ncbi:G-protein coupled receptors family 1 profile domain-containing protein [Caenorhabditis elegans]|uniref:G-protein coupled receptors family 1 profile domain-containing protein n=1 Tax=Caenorhabditis elegans TaxID=6239 RepID=O61910_CAEEL|nr:G-protein coupled receptors family 1 profile domain-containing protein [Caenorhabditis elegans]CCD66308.1 G-protein coupled receptors family 1 profile domain-containing protein [Caenorhabditis elegans]|eukprot:NP_503799.2 Serpentine Receptor, class W [Caenorhabditis elegans]
MISDKYLQIDFPGFEHSTARRLYRIERYLAVFTEKVLSYESIISITCILVNILHSAILTRKSMRNSSINIIMTAVAILDICTFFSELKKIVERFLRDYYDCFQSETYTFVIIETSFQVLQDYSRRCSTWLCFLIALIRTLVIRNPLNQSYQKLAGPALSGFAILGILFLSLPISVVFSLEYELMKSSVPSFCNSTETTYYTVISDMFADNDGYYLKIFSIVNGLVSNIIPCVLFPIVTFLLVVELWKSDKKRKNLSSTANVNDSRKTTRLVFYISITFFIAEFPLGITLGATWFFLDVPGMKSIMSYFYYNFSLLLSANTATHCIVCFFMSSQYRIAAKQVVSCGYLTQKNKATVIQVTHTSSARRQVFKK